MIPCGKGYKIDGTFVEVTASFGLKSITFFYNVNISIDRLMLHLTYKIA